MKPPSHQTVAAYLALFVALATGGAYAADKIGSRQIENNSIRSSDLKNRKAVRTKDVKPNGLRGKAIDEARLDASRFLPVAGRQGGGCNPESATFIDCDAAVNVTLPRAGRVVAIATGGQRSDGALSTAQCEIRIDGVPTSAVPANPGEDTVDNTAGTATNGFARTAVSDVLGAGRHRVALACNQGAGDVRIDHPTIAAFGISAG